MDGNKKNFNIIRGNVSRRPNLTRPINGTNLLRQNAQTLSMMNRGNNLTGFNSKLNNRNAHIEETLGRNVTNHNFSTNEYNKFITEAKKTRDEALLDSNAINLHRRETVVKAKRRNLEEQKKLFTAAINDNENYDIDDKVTDFFFKSENTAPKILFSVMTLGLFPAMVALSYMIKKGYLEDEVARIGNRVTSLGEAIQNILPKLSKDIENLHIDEMNRAFDPNFQFDGKVEEQGAGTFMYEQLQKFSNLDYASQAVELCAFKDLELLENNKEPRYLTVLSEHYRTHNQPELEKMVSNKIDMIQQHINDQEAELSETSSINLPTPPNNLIRLSTQSNETLAPTQQNNMQNILKGLDSTTFQKNVQNISDVNEFHQQKPSATTALPTKEQQQDRGM